MVTYIEAILLGIVQGITEWLPISSSGHVVLMKHLLGVSQPISFDIILHLGSLVAVLIILRKDIQQLIMGVLKQEKKYLLLAAYVILATIPIALFGFFAKDWLESVFNSSRTVAFGLLFTSALLFSTRIKMPKKNLSWGRASITGLAQACAIFPGVSRSGTTISTLLLLGIKGEEAARFSFLLFIPAILGATVLEIGSMAQISNPGATLVGFLASLIIGYLCLRLLLAVIRKGRFDLFGWYTLALGITVLILF